MADRDHDVDADGGVVTGRVLDADGTPMPFANVRLFYLAAPPDRRWVGISSKTADDQGRYLVGLRRRARRPNRIVAVDPETERVPRASSFNVQRNGQRLNVDIVFLGRGTFQGRTLRGRRHAAVATRTIRVTSLTDQSQYGATTDADGGFTIARIPVGNIFVEAVNVDAQGAGHLSARTSRSPARPPRATSCCSTSRRRRLTVKTGTLTGHVLRADGATPVAGVPVIVYYTNNSQPGVLCPP